MIIYSGDTLSDAYLAEFQLTEERNKWLTPDLEFELALRQLGEVSDLILPESNS